MGEQVQVRAGVWRTRDGREARVWVNRDPQTSSFWPWDGRIDNFEEMWKADGGYRRESVEHICDLVEYLGPLPKQAAPEPEAESEPEQQTTTDTLAEIEEGIAEIEKDVAELVQQDEACRLQAELLLVTSERETLRADLTEVASERDALVREINEVTAARDSLQQQLADMTKHSGELLESAQQARDERDLWAQRLVTKPSEENLQKQNAKQQIEINTLKDKLQDVTDDRETLRRQSETMTSERDELVTELEAMTDHCRRQHEQIRALQAELDAAGQQPAPADRSEQIERIWDEARERAVSEIIELLVPLQVARGTHAESVLQILPAVIRRYMDGGPDDVE
jgi:predicted  nucleic acid-binding Zn-ribbon protein